MKRIGVFVKPTEGVFVEPLKALIAVIEASGCEALLENRAAQALGLTKGLTRAQVGQACDLAVVLGGDGTMLGVARALAQFHKPMIGVNAGRLGFITDVILENMDAVLPAIFAGQYTSDRRYLLEGEVIRHGEVIYSNLAVNDMGMSHGRAGGMVEVVLSVNGVQICTQSADGIICSTPTGSTAYSLAAGGPILYPSLRGMTVVPVAPHTLSNRPIVLPSDVEVEIRLIDARDAVAYFDMQEFCDLEVGDALKIKTSNDYVEWVHPHGYDYFEVLRRKFKWNFMPVGEVH